MSDLSVGSADAVMIPERLKSGRRQYNRLDSITLLAAPLLGVCKGRALIGIKSVPGMHCGRDESMCFISRDLSASLYYPRNDAKGRRGPRYRWEGNGEIALGYLLDPSEKELLYEGK
jgi:hypothetical protein